MSKIVFKLFKGFQLGVFIGLLNSIFFSFVYSGNTFSPMPPAFVEKLPNELIAFIICVCLWGLIGVIFTSTESIFTNTDWSISKMTVVHALITYILFLPIAIYLNWINYTIKSILFFTLIYTIIYMIIWSISMIKAKNDIKQINKKLNKM